MNPWEETYETTESVKPWEETYETPKVTPRQTIQQQAPQQQGWWSTIGNDLKDIGSSVANRFDKITNPNSDIYKTGNVAEHSLRALGQEAALVGDVVGGGLRTLYHAITPDKIEQGNKFLANEALQATGAKGLINEVGTRYNQFRENNPNVARDVEAVANIASVVPWGKAAGLTKDVIAPALGATAKATGLTLKEGRNILKDTGRLVESVGDQAVGKNVIDTELKSTVRSGMEKGVRPTIKGKNTAPKTDAYYDKATAAVKDIVDNKQSITLTDEAGNLVQGETPKTLYQFLDAINQRKKAIYNQYHDMAVKAGDANAAFSAQSVVSKLDDISNDFGYSEAGRRYAAKLKNDLRNLHGQSPEVIEKRIANLNSTVGTKADNSIVAEKAKIEVEAAKVLRDELDETIMRATGDGYKELKKSYGNLKEIEKEVANRALVDARRNTKGLFDITDIYSGAELAVGVISMNPTKIARAAAMHGIKKYTQYLNDPNRIIKNMFDEVGNISAKGSGFTPSSKLGQWLNGKFVETPEPSMPKSPYSFNPQAPKTPMIEYRENITPQMRGLNEQLPNSPSKAIEFDNRGVPVGEPYMPDVIDVPFSSSTSPLNYIEGRLMPRLGYSDFDVVGDVNTLRRAKQQLPMDILERRSKYERY